MLTEKEYEIAFERVNFEEDDDDENPVDELCRYEFMELIVRVAGKKYNVGKKTDPDKPALCKTYTEALNRLIEEHLEVYFEPYPDAEFRTKYLLTLGCHNVFTSNLEILKDLFKKCNKKRGINNINAYEAIRDLMTCKQIGLSLNDAAMLFGISKMTVVDESGNNVSKHYTMRLVEFLEFIARTAAQIYDGPENLP
jgi:hypothetical protein